MKLKVIGIVLGGLLLVGCDQVDRSTGPAQPVTKKSAEESLPSVAHPEYVHWSKFPAKSLVMRRKVVSNPNGEVVATTKMWLESKSSDSVSVGSHITVKRPDMPLADNGEDFVSYPATYELPKGFEESQFYLPSMKAKEVGKEIVRIGKSEFQATIFEWEERSEAGPTTVKLWRSDEIPGKLLRQELFTESSETKSIEEATEFKLGNEPS
jgi:hypothetical protein